MQLRRQLILIAIAALFGQPLAALADDAGGRTKTYSPKEFHRLINSIALTYRRYENDADKKMKLAAMKAELKDKTDNLVIEIVSTVAQIKWDRGVASIYTAGDPPQIGKSTPQAPIAIKRSAPIYVPMTEEEAAGTKLKTTITIRAKVSYQPGIRLPLIGDRKLGQPIYDLSSTQSLGGSPGYYTTRSFVAKVGDKTLSVGDQ